MRSRRSRYRKNNNRVHGRSNRPETVYVPSPCNDEGIESKNTQESCDKYGEEEFSFKTQKKRSGGFSLKSFLGNFLGKSDNDDLIIIVLIVIIFLSRHQTDDECDGQPEENNDFSVTDFLSKASDILKKFNDNDILLIALLYILL